MAALRSIKGAHELEASADACTYAILPFGSNLCPTGVDSATVTASGRVPRASAGGTLVVTTVSTHLIADAHGERDERAERAGATEGPTDAHGPRAVDVHHGARGPVPNGAAGCGAGGWVGGVGRGA